MLEIAKLPVGSHQRYLKKEVNIKESYTQIIWWIEHMHSFGN